MIAKDFEPDPLAEVTCHAAGRFMENSKDLPVCKRLAWAVFAPGMLCIRVVRLLKQSVFYKRTVISPGYAPPEKAGGPGLCATFCRRAVRLDLRAGQLLAARRLHVALRAE